MSGISKATRFFAKQMERTVKLDKKLQTVGQRVFRSATEKVDKFIPSGTRDAVKNGAKGLTHRAGEFFGKMVDNFTEYVNTIGRIYKMK